MTATLRYRGDKSNLLEFAKNLDAFKKVPEKYTETTEIGGTLSLLSRLLIVYLVYTELRYYWSETNIIYQFEPDMSLDEQVQMHVDITVAMPCASLSGVDLMDETQQDVFAYGSLQREGVWWQMADADRRHFQSMQMTNHYLREEYHSVANILFKDILRERTQPKESEAHSVPAQPAPGPLQQLQQHPQFEAKYDACRLHGTLGINKVAGVLHLVGGAQPVVGMFDDHWMIEFRRMPANFTHRINRLSFGQYSRRIVQPLEGDETTITEEATTVQYFIKVVPTEIQQTFSTVSTFQYAVTENVRKLDSERNSYGSPGIYFKYDWSALKVVISHDRDYFLTFVIRLCSIISGIIVISGAVNALLLGLQRRLLNTFAPQLYQRLPQAATAPPTGISVARSPAMAPTMPVNELLNAANLMANVDISAYLPTAAPKSDM
ncbi:endoplasmic reticulum-Golgi intermediate compartment protein 2 [Drosophila grimshawi]|uniref:GH12601 n=1 Tax=Drosophila grimshawi TaxID=7222 RepID=B4JK68_DROGR|nr:endoplasmic reticulum-Golgi intermediate compartment protein 2 [Drosophila grimshawi]XP_032594411.1 endoplasmic reticulum-Golgi intermediate compartment protein 2 [Drosophila grimshawi]XP_032594412.1 endoplasmic reticulum-Golgi intermediate compartment protein 2 [Drosophila grimshawi]EDV99970.1 GH12601 [Drosophila grimshawi]